MARNQVNETPNIDLKGYHIATTVFEENQVFDYYYNPDEKDRTKAWKKVPR